LSDDDEFDSMEEAVAAEIQKDIEKGKARFGDVLRLLHEKLKQLKEGKREGLLK
jgi:hypothetical protein